MKRIDKKLSELPELKLNQVKPKVESLLEILKCRDRGEDLTGFLEPYGNRLDKYFAEVVKDCNTSVVCHYEPFDVYYMINKARSCINLTKLCNSYKRIHLSEWLSRYSSFYFETNNSTEPLFSVEPTYEEQVHILVFEMAMEAVHLANFNNQSVYEFIEINSECGGYIPIESYNPKRFELNEFHIIMFTLYHFLLRNPIRIEVASNKRGDKEIFLESGFEGYIPLLDMYDSYRETGSHPIAIMEEILSDINSYIFRCLNSDGTI